MTLDASALRWLSSSFKLWSGLWALIMLGLAADAPVVAGQEIPAEAHFTVSDAVVNPDLQPFTTTLGTEFEYGNGARLFRRGGGFEPIIYRDWLLAQQDAPDRIIAAPETISHWETLRSGALDGAAIQILRIENGAFRVVRKDRVREGGFRASGWSPVLPWSRALPPAARTFPVMFDHWNRPDAQYFYTLRAVDTVGRLGPVSNVVALTSPANLGRAKTVRPERPETIVLDQKPQPEAGTRSLLPTAQLTVGPARDGTDNIPSLVWTTEANPAIAGWILYRSDVPPEMHRGYGIDLADGAGGMPVKSGDLVRIEKRFTAPRRVEIFTNRVWQARQENNLVLPGLIDFFPDDDPARTWRLAPHGPDSPVHGGGESYLDLTLDTGSRAHIGGATNSGTEQEWYPVLEPGKLYRVEVWLKADRPATVRFELTGFHADPAHRVAPIPFRVGIEWQKYTATFTPKALDTSRVPGFMRLAVRGPIQLGIDNFRVYRADQPYLALMTRDSARLQASGMAAMRMHGMSTTRRRTFDLAQMTNLGGGASGIRLHKSLPVSLKLAQAAGMDPWLTIEPHLDDFEWLGLIEYLAAPYDSDRDTPKTKPWAAKRAAQGRLAPWTDAFHRVFLELGNETWNRLYNPWTFPAMQDAVTGRRYSRGAVYGLWQSHVSAILRQSPYWTDALEQKFVTVIGGQEVYPGYGADAARNAPSADLLTTGAYIGGWEAGAPIPGQRPEDYARLLTHVVQSAIPYAEEHSAEANDIAQARGRPLELGTYEAGPGYVMNGLNGARVSPEEALAQEKIMKSLASATATLDTFLARAQLGYTVQNFYGFGPGSRWRSHAFDYRGGQDYPPWMLLTLFNREATGDLLDVDTVRAPRADLAPGKHRFAIARAPLVTVYATRRDDRLAVIAISRRVPGIPDASEDGHTRVTIDLPIASADRLRRFHMTGTYDSHNVDAEEVRIIETRIPVSGSLPRLEIPDLPPGVAHVYVFEGIL